MQCSRRTHPIAPTGKKRQKTLAGRVLGEVVRLKGLTNLQSLDLRSTQITDAGLVHLRGMTNPQSLNLNNTQLTDAGLVNLKGMTRLQSPWFCDTQVTRTGTAELQQALPTAGSGSPPSRVRESGPHLLSCPPQRGLAARSKHSPCKSMALTSVRKAKAKLGGSSEPPGCRFKSRRPCCKSGPSPYGCTSTPFCAPNRT